MADADVTLPNGAEGSALQLAGASPDAVVVRVRADGKEDIVAVIEVKTTTCFMLRSCPGVCAYMSQPSQAHTRTQAVFLRSQRYEYVLPHEQHESPCSLNLSNPQPWP
jgi:hypothetical protein